MYNVKRYFMDLITRKIVYKGQCACGRWWLTSNAFMPWRNFPCKDGDV